VRTQVPIKSNITDVPVNLKWCKYLEFVEHLFSESNLCEVVNTKLEIEQSRFETDIYNSELSFQPVLAHDPLQIHFSVPDDQL